MQIKLKEEPREWRKFTLQSCAILSLLSAFLSWRGVISVAVLPGVFALLLVVGLMAVARPGWFRGFYRAGMITSAWMGEWMGRITLTVFFFLAIVPLGCVLRLLGYDPLALKKKANASSYWHAASTRRKLEQMF